MSRSLCLCILLKIYVKMALRRRTRRSGVRRRSTIRRSGRRLRGMRVPARVPRRVGPLARQRTATDGRRKRPRGWTEYIFGKRRKTVKDSSGYTQLSKHSYSKKLGRLTLSKRLRGLTQTYDFVWRATQKLAGNGVLFMNNYFTGTGSAMVTYRPWYLVDLTSAYTNGGNGTPVWRFKRTQSAAFPQYDLEAVNGFNASGSPSASWQSFYIGNNGSQVLSEKAILKWSEIRLDLWGAQSQPCDYTLTLCQFDERVLPLDAGGTTILSRQAVDWWDNLAGKLILNPNLRKPPNGEFENMMKVIDRRKFLMNPTATYETDTDPHCKSVRLFYRFNRLVNFAWQNRVPQTCVDAVDPASSVTFSTVTGATGTFSTPQTKARVFLLITCGNYRGTQSGATENKADTGSINMSIYNRWMDV